MEDNNKKKISQLIKNNKYFESGMSWYYDKYLGFFWEKKLFAIISIPLILLLIFAILINYKKFSLASETFPISSYVNIENETLNVKKLDDKNQKNPNILIAKYLLSKYILAYESLQKEEIEENEKFILENSSNLIYFAYKKRNEVFDEKNPFVNSLQNKDISFEIENIQFSLNDENLPYIAIVSIIQKNRSNSLDQKKFKIEVNFLMDNIFFINKDFDRFNFLVLKYNKL